MSGEDKIWISCEDSAESGENTGGPDKKKKSKSSGSYEFAIVFLILILIALFSHMCYLVFTKENNYKNNITVFIEFLVFIFLMFLPIYNLSN